MPMDGVDTVRADEDGGHRPDTIYRWSGANPQALLAQLDRDISQALDEHFIAGSVARKVKHEVPGCRLAFSAQDPADAIEKLRHAHQRILASPARAFATPSGIYYNPAAPTGTKVAWLFPGQGSQYRGMLSALMTHDPRSRQRFDDLDARFDAAGLPRPCRTICATDAEDNADALHSLGGGGQAALVAGLVIADIASRLGIPCDGMLGHSNGEMTALICSRTLHLSDSETPSDIFFRIAQAFQSVDQGGDISGTTLAITATDRVAVDRVLATWRDRAHLMLDNCPQQLVVFAADVHVTELCSDLHAAGALVLPLPFARAYHTPLMSAYTDWFMTFYRTCNFGPGAVPLYSACSTEPFPQDARAIAALANAQWLQTVRFGETVRQMHRDGYRVFLEVGAGGRLTGFVRNALKGLPHHAIALDQESKPSTTQIPRALAQIFVAGVDFNDGALPWEVAAEEVPGTSADAAPLARSIAAQYAQLMQEFLDSETRLAQAVFEGIRQQGAREDADTIAPVPAIKTATPPWPGIASMVDEGSDRFSAQVKLRADDPYLADHTFAQVPSRYQPALKGLAVLPFCMSLEIAAQMARQLVPRNHVVSGLENARGYRWIALDEGALTLRLEAHLGTRGTDGSRRIDVTLWETSSVDSRPPLKAFEATVITGPSYAMPDTAHDVSSPPIPVDLKRPLDEYMETLLFHGRTYRLLEELTGLSSDAIGAWTSSAPESISTDGPIFGPLFDIPGQLLAYWGSEVSDDIFTLFPVGVSAVRLYGPAQITGQRLHITGNFDSTNDLVRAQFMARDVDGQPVFSCTDWRGKYDKAPESVLQALFWKGVRTPIVKAIDVGTSVVWLLEGFPVDFLEQGHGIWKRSLAHATQCEDDIAAWNTLPENGPRRVERLLGAIAAKEALRLHLADTDRIEIDLADMSIDHDARGAPFVRQIAGPPASRLPAISISHTDGRVAAMLAPAGMHCGVDIEVQGRGPRSDDWLNAAFTTEELEILARAGMGDRKRYFWMAKEAASKAVGTGLLGDPTIWRISSAKAAGATVEIMGDEVPVAFADQEDLMIATCLLDANLAAELAARLMPLGADD